MRAALIPAAVLSAAASLATSGRALALDHGHGGSGGHSGVRVGIGFSGHDSGFSVGFGRGIGFGYRGYSYPSYYYPRPYYRPAYYYGYGYPYYSSYGYPVYTYPTYAYTYDSPQTVVVSSAPQVVTETGGVQPQAGYAAPQPQPVAAAISPQASATDQPTVTPASPAPTAPQPEQARFRDRELGDAYLRMNDPEDAARVYKRYLTAWNWDGTVTRNYGLALVARGETREGFRSVVQGYKLEPGLIKRPIRVEDFGGRTGFERLLDNASHGASAANSPEGWLTVAILQNAGGKPEPAQAALTKAREAGLDQATLDQFTLEIVKPDAPKPADR